MKNVHHNNLTQRVAVKSMELEGEDLAGESAERAAAMIGIECNHRHVSETAHKVS